jgi:hypothetical protein
MSRVDLLTVAAIGGGGLFLYAGVKDVSVLSAVTGLIEGKSPKTAASAGAGLGETASVATATGSGSANPTAGTWTHGGLVNLWIMAGGSQASANNAACHAIQESSGNASVTSPNPNGGINVGLWQLDTEGVGAGNTVAQLQNPLTNARITVRATRDGQDWSQWATPGC